MQRRAAYMPRAAHVNGRLPHVGEEAPAAKRGPLRHNNLEECARQNLKREREKEEETSLKAKPTKNEHPIPYHMVMGDG